MSYWALPNNPHVFGSVFQCDASFSITQCTGFFCPIYFMRRLNSLITKDLNIPHASLLMTACWAALQAGEILKSLFDKPISISLKGPTNLVTEADLAAEKAIVTCLMQDTPALAFMTEESEQTHSPALSRQVWVVDPLDGTTNFAHGFPHFTVSIALLDSGSPLVAAIYAPMVDELFYAVRNYGAWLNTRPHWRYDDT